MAWTTGELRRFRLGSNRRRGRYSSIVYREAQILAPYDRVLAQLIAEDLHGDTHRSHEAYRRQQYARRVLDAFGKEYTAYAGSPILFRSHVLTPILQRQLFGVPDSYLPAVSTVVGNGAQHPTIQQATEFYLKEDPTDPQLIPTYRYNMVFIPEIRWHLATVLGTGKIGDDACYNRIRANQDDLMSSLTGASEVEDEMGSNACFDEAMVAVIMAEHLDTFFAHELEQVIRTSPHPNSRSL
jgi:hypothetical protein